MNALTLATDYRDKVPYSLVGDLSKMVGVINSLGAKTEAMDARITKPLTLQQIRDALQQTGATPLNIFQLLGAGSDTGVIQVGTHAQRLAISAITSPQGLLFWETDRTALYVVDVQLWKLIVNEPYAVTLAPNTKPADLVATDVNFLIRSTDFDRLYRWTGAAWTDAPGQPQRGEIVDFAITLGADFTPGAWWSLCNGTAGVVYSKPDGTTGTVTVPDLTTANRFRRATSGATGGTGGSATTHTHPIPHTHDVTINSADTGNNDGSVEVQAGLGTTVADDPHKHDNNAGQTVTSGASSAGSSGTPSGAGGDDALPPYMNFRPYMRL